MITIEEFKKKQSEKCRLIGLDLGSKRIGVSICDEKQLIATPYKTIHKSKNNELITDDKYLVEKDLLKENNLILSIGKKRHLKLILN